MSRTITLENGQKITISEESYKELSEATKVIKVPDNIKLAGFGDNRFIIGFGDNQWLTYNSYYGTWEVNIGGYSYDNTRHLVRVKPEDRVPGRVYYVSYSDKPRRLDDVCYYQLYLGDNKCAFIEDHTDVLVDSYGDYMSWWEVRTL